MIALELVISLVILYFIWRSTRCVIFPSPQFIFASAYFLYIYLGYILMQWDPFYVEVEGFEPIGLLIRLGFYSIVIAGAMTYRLKENSYESYIVYPCMVKQKSNGAWELLFYTGLAFVFVIISLIYLILIPTNPLQAMFVNPELVSSDREAATTGLKSFGFFSNIFYNLMPLVWLCLYILGNNKYWIIVFLTNIVVTLSTGQKAPFIYILLLFILANGLRNGKFSYGKALLIGIVAVVVMIIIVLFQNLHLFSALDIDAVSGSITALSRRIFYVGPLTLFNYYQTFPEYHPFLIDAATSVPSDQIVYRNIYGDQFQGTVNTVSLGIFYAWTGNIFISSFLFFVLSIAIFLIPYFFKYFSSDKLLYRSIYVTYGLLLLKLVITDWYTLIPFFILSFLVIAGLNHFSYHIVQGVLNGKYIIRCGVLSFVITIVALIYFSQGQLRILMG